MWFRSEIPHAVLLPVLLERLCRVIAANGSAMWNPVIVGSFTIAV
jgi:hypothetical protein